MSKLRESRVVVALFSALFLACGSKQAEPAEPVNEPATPVTPAEPVPAEPVPTTEPSGTAEDSGGPPPEATPPAEGAEGGRLAFVTCEEPRKSACTREYRPVCGEVDTGIRCIKAPCPSTERKTFSNGCEACADPKVAGYFPMACDAMTTEKAP